MHDAEWIVESTKLLGGGLTHKKSENAYHFGMGQGKERCLSFKITQQGHYISLHGRDERHG